MSAVAASIISALISAGAAIIVGVLNSRNQHNKLLGELKTRDEIHSLEIKNLRETVEKHNTVIERTYHLEKTAGIFEEQIKVVNHRLDDLERHEERRQANVS